MDKIYTNIQSWGSTLYVRYLENGQRLQERVTDFHPRVWIPAQSSSVESDFKNLQDYPVIEFDAGNIKETREFIERNKGVGNFAVYGNIQPEYQWISQNCTGTIPWNVVDIVVAYIDIECTCENGFPSVTDANEEINAITIKFSNLEKKIVLGFDYFTGEIEDAIYIPCGTEEILLDKFLKVWKSNYPDIVSGWHVKFFDIPYLINRINRVFGEAKTKTISPWKILREETIEIMGKKVQTYDMFGIAVLDYLDLYKKFTYSAQESYKLDYIASVELGEKKIDYSEHGSLHLLYKEDYNKFLQYNARDVDLVVSLENKMKLIELAMTMAYDAKVNFDDVFSQVRMWDVIIYNHLLSKGYVIPDRQESRKEQIEGAYVKDPKPGFYNWVVSFDLQSLYPHLIMGGNFSPDTIVDKIIPGVTVDKLISKSMDLSSLKENDYSMSATGQLYRRDKESFLAQLMSWMFEQRKIYKSKMIQAEKDLEIAKKNGQDTKQILNDISKYKNLQMAKKIALNSAYGAIANKYFRFYDKRIAESITIAGQLAIRWVSDRLNLYLQKLLKTKKDYVIAVDTDSCYLNLEDLVNKFFKDKSKDQIIDLLDKICKEELQKIINASYEDMADYLNSYSQKMIMKREAIADRGIWTAKKRYMLNVYDSEGVRYTEPKMKIMGIEAIKSSTPKFCRDKIKEAIKIIMTSDQQTLQDYIDSVKTIFLTLPPEDIAFPRGVNNLSTYSSNITLYTKGTPIHVRGSLIYNNLLKKHDLLKSYTQIYEGDKIKFLYLREPNPIRENIISFNSVLPKEFDLHQYIDYNLQFQKTFVEPISTILDAISWSSEKKSTLDSFFD
jgi:DNA polymerase elongation subunit (family B)